MRLVMAGLLAFPLFATTPASAAQIPENYLNSVVALGVTVTSPAGPAQPQWVTEGTGFFYGYLTHDDPEPSKRLYELYLVTARHVVEEHATRLKSDIEVRLNPSDAGKTDEVFPLPSEARPPAQAWFYHPNRTVDVAVIQLNPTYLKDRGFAAKFFESDRTTVTTSKMKDLGVTAGDGVFVLGFPMNLAGAEKNYVIVRQGVVARVSELLDHASPRFLIDSHVFPGNSGGPVILKGEITAIEGTKPQTQALLAGMVVSYLPYNDSAVSQQTGLARILFQENSGLAEVIPVDAINDTIAAYRAARDTLKK
jgi:S1-C subfamily serine protease